ncbi:MULTISPECIES: cupin domain-containing protein [unclassified Nocardioides]|uniref:cupin domain-containing protein n=1 Tax=unclassified Nocardioides TaxID=2615069 RepID=UPI0000570945|nr:MULTISPECIES: cupin domain-containing protein [unclassified Nocardioides]ABL79943.1 Cupin 2, conserved barrel domain protein [Nocardioides sp. JS614]
MKSGSTNDLEYRFGDHGPAYVIRDPSSEIGVLRLRPGDDMTNHIHHFCDESFIVLEGSATLWVGCERRYLLGVGDVYRCSPGEMHYFVNETDAPFRMVFVKSPASPGDTVNLPWTPGQPAPHVPETPAL